MHFGSCCILDNASRQTARLFDVPYRYAISFSIKRSIEFMLRFFHRQRMHRGVSSFYVLASVEQPAICIAEIFNFQLNTYSYILRKLLFFLAAIRSIKSQYYRQARGRRGEYLTSSPPMLLELHRTYITFTSFCDTHSW